MSESIWNDPRITEYVLNELSDDRRKEFESEMKSNPELAAAVEEAHGITNQLQGLYESEKTPPLESDRRQAIVGESINQPTPITDARAPSWGVPITIVALAAVLLLLVGIAPWLRQQATTTADRISPAEEAVDQSSAESTQPSVANVRDELSETVADKAALASEKFAPDESAIDRFVSDELVHGDFAIDAPTNAPAAAEAEEKGMPIAPAIVPSPILSQSNGQAENRLFKRSSDPQPFDSKARETVEAKSLVEKAKDRVAVNMGDVDGDSGLDPLTRRINPSGSKEIILEPQPPKPMVKAEVELQSKSDQQVAQPAAEGAKLPNHAWPAYANAPNYSRLNYGLEAKKKPADPAARTALTINRAYREDMPAPVLPNAPGDLFGAANPEGEGPHKPGDQYAPIDDNPFKRVDEHPLSTFSVDVDTASYSKTRDYLMRANSLPRPDAVRIEELLNYFDYDYQPPSADDKHPFAARMTVTGCPWNENHRLARIAIKGKTMKKAERPRCNLVFLLDTSGSMNAHNKLPLVIEGMKMLTEQLNDQDQVAITVYAGSAGLVLDSVSAKKDKKIRKALTELSAGGSTNGGQGMALAYHTARENFISDGVNRVILCTDGDFNVGVTGTDALVRMVEKEAKGGVFLSVLGFGMGNHNDAMLEQISGRGNGNYAFIDSPAEAQKVLVDQTSGTLVTIAKDVKLQLEFNPKRVSQYRLIGYENRVLAKEDFNDDQKDAGEIGAGHAVTALYEIVPAGMESDTSPPKVDELKYQKEIKTTDAADTNELLTLKLRYKLPDEDESTLVEFPVIDEDGEFESADKDVRFAAAVAGFGMTLRRSKYVGSWTLSDVLSVAEESVGKDEYGLRAEFLQMVRKASELMGEE